MTFGLPVDYFDTYRSNIAAVTTRDVLAAAKAHVNPDDLQIVVVGNPEVVEAPLRALPYGEFTIREAAEA